MVTESLKHGLIMYVNQGISTGSFLRAVLMNDLRMAFAFADDYNKSHMDEIVKYVEEHVPVQAWGSAEKVTLWLDSFKHDAEHP